MKRALLAVAALVAACGSDTLPASVSGTCGTDKLCIDIAIDIGPGEFHVAVFWLQLDDESKPLPMEIVYDHVVADGTKHIEIATSSIPAPNAENLLTCDRGGTRGAQLPCINDPKVGYGYVMAYRGAVLTNDATQVLAHSVGFANAIFGYSATAVPKGTASSNTAAWDAMFPDGIRASVQIYQLGRPEGGSFDRPLNSAAGQTNGLQAKGPNLT